ncbi:MAG: ATP-binding protein, partial [Coriobacteriia bacterium]|nr:ATP-binding protein [Coriobacteriia bacterium]
KNPFTPSFGSIPLMMAGRDQIINDILEGLDNGPGDPNRATIFTGARGTGKTVLLAKIAEEAASRGWISANINAEAGMLDEILVQLYTNAKEFLTPESLAYLTSISAGGFGISRQVKQSSRKSTWRSELTSLIQELNEKEIGVLITVDEMAIDIEEAKTLIVTFQHLVRERREAALIMAGLPQKISELLRDDKITFMRRAFQHHLGPVDENEVRLSMRKTVEFAGRKIEPTALSYAVKYAEGFPFMIQLIGYQMWRQNPEKMTITLSDAKEGVLFAQNDLERMILNQTYQDLSPKEISFLSAMLDDGEYSMMSDITERMNVSTKYAGEYRRRLIEQGVIGERGRGKVTFEMPQFREFIQSKLAE